MNDLLKLHKTVGGNGLNKLTYREYLDEHFNLGELDNVIVEDNTLKNLRIDPTCLAYYPFTENLGDMTGNTTITNDLGTLSIDTNEKALRVVNNRGLLKNLNIANLTQLTVEYMWKPTHSNYGGGLFMWGLGHSLHPLGTNGTKFGFWDGTNRIANIVPTLNEWCHQMYTYNNGENKLYHNGNLVLTWTYTKTFSNTDMQMFCHQTSTNYNQGYVKHLKVHSKVLTEPTMDNIPSYHGSGYRISPPIELPKNVVSSKIDWEGEGKISVANKSYLQNPNEVFPIDTYTDFDFTDFTPTTTSTITTITSKQFTVRGNGHNKGMLNLALPSGSGAVKFNYTYSKGTGSYNTSNQHLILGMRDNTIVEGAHYNDNTYNNAWELQYTAFDTNQIKLIVCKDGNKTTVWTSSAITNFTMDVRWTNKFISITLYSSTGNELHSETYPLDFTTLPTTLMKGFALYNGTITMKILDEITDLPFINEDLQYVPCCKGENLPISLNQPYLYLKQEVKGEETISNVKLEMKYKPKKEYIRPSNLKEEEDTNKTYLYKPGDECTPLTGGWGITNSSHNVTTPTYERTDRLRAHIVCGNSNGHHCGFITNKAIDLTGYSKIYFDMSNYHTDEFDRGLINIKSGSSSVASIGSPAYENAPRQIREIDISNINTSCIIQITAETVWNGKQAEVVIYNIWLEK